MNALLADLLKEGYTMEMMEAREQVCEAEEKLFEAIDEAGIDAELFTRYKKLEEKRTELYFNRFIGRAITEALTSF